MTTDHELRGLLSAYERSLNESDADLAAACYADDGTFMASGAPTVSGGQLKQAYAQIFDTIRLDVRFSVDEVVVVSPDFAYAMTQSHGTQTVLASGVQTPESNRELFTFVHERGQWKISRYLFNKPA